MSYATNPLFTELRSFENDVIVHFKARVFEACLADISEKKILEMLMQRRHLSCLFISFCDSIYPTLPTPANRRIVETIIKEEYGDYNHRAAFIHELEGLGVGLETIRNTRYTKHTLKSGRLILSYGLGCAEESEVFALESLRFFAELLAGEEFMFFYRKLFVNSPKRKDAASKFLGPHIDLDLSGSTNGGDSHAELYLQPISDLLVSEQALNEAKDAVVEAAAMRAHFYGQFCSGLKMGRADIKRAVQHS